MELIMRKKIVKFSILTCLSIVYVYSMQRPRSPDDIGERPAQRRRVEINIQEASGQLFEAVIGGHFQRVQEIVSQCPLSQRYQLMVIQDNNGETVLHWAAFDVSAQVTRVLLEYCPKDLLYRLLVIKNNYGNTVLHQAAVCGNDQVVKIILEYFSAGQRYQLLAFLDNDGNTVLLKAVLLGYNQVVKIIIEYCPEGQRYQLLAFQNNYDFTALSIAQFGNYNQIENIIREYYPEGQHLISNNNCFNFIPFLGYDSESQRDEETEPQLCPDIFELIINTRIDQINNIDVDGRDSDNHVSILREVTACAREIMAFSSINKYGYYAWLNFIRKDLSVEYNDRTVIVLHILRKKSNSDEALFLWIAKRGLHQIMSPLLSIFCNKYSKNKKKLRQFLTAHNNSLLCLAVRNGYHEVVALLLESLFFAFDGCFSELRKVLTADRHHPLVFASYYGYDKIVELLISALQRVFKDKPEMLKKALTPRHNAPLRDAARQGYYRVVSLLLSALQDALNGDNEYAQKIFSLNCESCFMVLCHVNTLPLFVPILQQVFAHDTSVLKDLLGANDNAYFNMIIKKGSYVLAQTLIPAYKQIISEEQRLRDLFQEMALEFHHAIMNDEHEKVEKLFIILKDMFYTFNVHSQEELKKILIRYECYNIAKRLSALLDIAKQREASGSFLSVRM